MMKKLLAVAALAILVLPLQLGAQEDMTTPTWTEIDQLIADQQFQAAVDALGVLRAQAREQSDEPGWTRALVRETQLRTALHGYETTVRFLREEEWPSAPRYRMVLQLFYAQSLVTYTRSYSWEIRQRERVAVSSDDEVDLKAWTLDQIVTAAHRAYAEAWDRREAWGDASLGELSEFFVPNNYPPQIRGTQRDAVTYLWADLLADTSLWRPEHANEIYRLDAAELATDELEDVDAADPDVHPLVRATALYADLERWHRGKRRPEAAFEARRERLQRLWTSFSQKDDRKVVRGALEEGLDQVGRQYPWWSMGMATLSGFVRQDAAPDALIEARRLALEGETAHPDSPGGQHCRSIIASIESPNFRVEAMKSDGLAQRSIRVSHQNLADLHFRAFAVDPDNLVRGQDRNLLPAYREVQDYLANKKPVATWTVELPATPDYRTHVTYVTPPFEAPGIYLVVASARRDFARDGNQRMATNLIVGDLVLTRPEQTSTEVRVLSGASGRPQDGVRIALWQYDYQRGHRKLEEKTTGKDGKAAFTGLEARRNHLLIARRGQDVALLESFFYNPGHERRDLEPRTLVYTDRSIYRPGQKVQWKVVAYKSVAEDEEPGQFEIHAGAKVTVDLNDLNGQQVARVEVETNEFGSASGEFEIPVGRPLGRWQIRTAFAGSNAFRGGAVVQVEEYKRPTFEAEIRDPEDALRLNRPARLQGEVRYYFGLPVTSGEVRWRVTREPVWRYGWRFSHFMSLVPQGSSQVLDSGTAELDADGRFTVEFTPEADERLAEAGSAVSYRYRLSVDVTDDGGETRSASRSFRLGFVAVEADFQDVPGFLRQGAGAELGVARTNLDGVPRAGKGRWRVHALEQPASARLPAELPPDSEAADDGRYRTPGDELRPRWDFGSYSPQRVLAAWKDGKEHGHGDLEHGDDGKARLVLPKLAPGAYRIHYSTEDEFGETFETAREILILGEKLVGEKPTSLALAGLLVAETTDVAVGGVARIAVHSGLADQEMVLTIARGDELERRTLESGPGVEIVEIPIGKNRRGGFTLVLDLVRDHQHIALRETVHVPWDDRRLEIELATFRDRLKPGAREKWSVVLKGEDKALAAGAAELLAYMYDRSLDLFAAHKPTDPLSLYPRFLSHPVVWTSLGQASQAFFDNRGFVRIPRAPAFHGDRLAVIDGYGIGGPGRRGRAMKTMRVQSMAAMPQAASEGADIAFRGGSPRVEAAEAMVMADATAAPPLPAASPPAAEPAPAAPADIPLRSDFSETAFWEPHLVLGDDGSVAFEFTVPDSLTEWNVWVHAVTRDLRSGQLHERVKTVKELMVRPYLPRFLRAGDRAALRVVVNNAGDEELAGELDFDVVDPETEESVAADFGLAISDTQGVEFAVEPGGGTELEFEVTAPARLRNVAFKVVARAGGRSDGELRPLPVLPSRVYLAQSRFTTLQGKDRRVLEIADLARDDDPSLVHEQLIFTLDAQLFYGVLQALPYLVDYPYECTEQTLNRFVSTGIVSSLYDDYPAIARMAAEFSRRETRYEAWDEEDPNRRMGLEETPWLVTARGGAEEMDDLVNVLDPKIAALERDVAIDKLRRAQTSLGGFPWWSGGPPSVYMTLYIVDGFSRALEFGVDVPQDMVQKAWAYLHRHYVDDLARRLVEDECCWETITYLNYVLSNYPDTSWTGNVFTEDDRRAMLDFSKRHRRKHSPRLKSYLALTLHRAGDSKEAARVFASVMDSAKTTRDEGTFWAAEDRSWLWYNDTIESHAFALRTLTELMADDARRHGLVQWLFINKHLNHWKSTRATAEVIYSLIHYLEKEGALGVREDATVKIGSKTHEFVFEPDRYTGKDNRVVIAGEDVEPSMAKVEVSKESPGFAFASVTWHFSTEELPEAARGDFFQVTRTYFKRVLKGTEWVLEPLAQGGALEVGDQVEVHLSLRSKHAAEYVHLRDPRPAGFEPETLTSRYKWDLGVGWYFFFEWLPVGEYTFKYRLRANLAGTFRTSPAMIQSMYAPEITGYSSGAVLEIGARP